MSIITRLKVPRKTLFNDLIAALVMASGTVPGSLANAVLAGTNPVYGVYSTIAGTAVAAVFTSSVIMNVDTTSATAIATGDTLSGIAPEQHLEYLVVLSLLVGLFMLLFGFLKLGFLVRFISNAVMVGFLSGLGAITILGQAGDLTGYYSEAPNKVFQTIDTIFNFREIDPATFIVGLLTIALIVVISRTRFERYSFLIAMVVTTILVLLPVFDSVAVVGDTTDIPQGLPPLNLPNLSLIPGMVLPALAVAIIALVQASGVSQSIPNPDGDYPDPSGDFRGQGAGNVAVGFLGGLPVGGSLSGTIFLQSVGGVSRWANIFTGLFAALSLLILAPLIELLPMPTLAGMLVVIGVSMINVPRIETVWHTGAMPLTIMIITFVFTLFTPVQVAVAVGVALHILLYVYKSAEKVRVERLVPTGDGGFIEDVVPEVLTSRAVVVLQPIGSLFFAGAAEFEDDLPDVGEAHRAVVIFRLRDRDEVGSTFIRLIERYAKSLQVGGNKLMLDGLNERVLEQLEETEVLDLLGRENVFLAKPRFGEALQDAVAAAERWIADADEQTD
jgi:SulP family sulfate permease